MSGPKCAEWYVEFNAYLDERARAEIWVKIRELQVRERKLLDGFTAAREKYGTFSGLEFAEDALPSQSAPLEQLEAFLARFRETLVQNEAKLNAGIAQAKADILFSAIADEMPDDLVSDEELFSITPNPNTEALPGNDDKRYEEQKEDARRLFARLSGEVKRERREEIERLLTKFAQTDEAGRRDRLLQQLRHDVQVANREAAQQKEAARNASELRRMLRGLQGEQVSAVDHELSQVERFQVPLSDQLVQKAHSVARQARFEVDREYTADVIREELEKMGYQVEEGFETAFVRGGEITASKPEWKDYTMELSVDPDAGKFDVRLARYGEASKSLSSRQALLDKRMEERHCEDFSKLLLALYDRNIVGRVSKMKQPGEERMKVIEGRREKARQMQLGNRPLQAKEL